MVFCIQTLLSLDGLSVLDAKYRNIKVFDANSGHKFGISQKGLVYPDKVDLMPHGSFYVISVHTIKLSAQFMALAIYGYTAAPVFPVSSSTPKQSTRNEIIRERSASGETYAKIAADYGLSENRVYQIVNHRRK